jgi:hypothetical protein
MATTQDALSFARNHIAHINAFLQIFTDLQRDMDRIAQDPDLAQGAADAMNSSGRSGLTAANFTNAGTVTNAMTQTFNGGSPTNKSVYYDLL